jgi:hypothetical protein
LKVIFSLGAGVDHLMGDPALPDVPADLLKRRSRRRPASAAC